MRKRPMPRSFWLSSRAMPSASTMSRGILIALKVTVFLKAFQNSGSVSVTA
ncbi:MAG: hypothetical protein IPK19_06375 [Chloroflexi bacterium]|nr:hypothetical protein [Chloroflexota bacterium]